VLQARGPCNVCATTWEERALPSICSCCHRRVVARSRGTESFWFDAAQHEAPPSRWPERRPPLLASRTAYGCCQCQAHPAGRRRHGCGRPNPCGLSALAALACQSVIGRCTSAAESQVRASLHFRIPVEGPSLPWLALPFPTSPSILPDTTSLSLFLFAS
jgi:hypothetical protein